MGWDTKVVTPAALWAWLLAALFLLGVLEARTFPCPRPCSCRGLGGANPITVNCSGLGLAQAPLSDTIASGDNKGPLRVGTLDLSRNNITALGGSLVNFTSLQELNLSGNALTVLEASVFESMPQLAMLDLSHNEIHSIEVGALYNLSSLRSLKLSFNNLTTLESGVFDGLPSLTSLDLSKTAIQIVEEEAFYNLSSLVTLDLSNNSIHTIEPGAFYNLLNLRSLDLSHNELTSVQEVFAELQTISNLNISHNQLTQLGNATFDDLASLEILDLSYNQLQILPDFLLSGLWSLKELYLQHNALLALPPSLLPGLPELTILNLRSNQLSSVGQEVTGMSHLTFLDLAGNPVREIRDGFLDGVYSLVHLDLDHTSLTTFDIPVVQQQQQQLQWLSLSGMKNLSQLPHNAFHGLSSLRHLNLSHNPRLAFIHPHVFSQLSAMQDIDLRHNNISVLSSLTFHSLANLQHLWLGGNPFQCDCQLAWLAQDLHNNVSSLADGSDLTCRTFNGTLLWLQDSYYLDHLACSGITEVNATELVKFRVGSSARLVCDYELDPSIVLLWRTPHNDVFTYHAFHSSAISHLADPNDTGEDGPFHRGHWWHHSGGYFSELSSWPQRLQLLSDGSLYIDYVLRSDSGPYLCMAYNAHYNTSAKITLRLDYTYMANVKIMSLFVGLSLAMSFLLLTGIHAFISAITKRFVNKRRRVAIKQMLDNIDLYRSSQISKVRENCSNQLGKIRETYHNQVERLRDNYGSQVKRVRQGCSFQVDRIRDNYSSQLERLRGYSSHQIEQIREVYSSQLLKMRDYGSQQLERIRETYKLQQKHIIKLLETMNIDNCKSIIESECTRTESMIFESELLAKSSDCAYQLSPDHSCSGSDVSEYVTASTSKASSQESIVDMELDDAADPFSIDDADCDEECILQAVLEGSYGQPEPGTSSDSRNHHILPMVIEMGEEDDLSETSRESDETVI